MRHIIGLIGAKGAGKDTCATFLIQDLNFKRIGFADALYEEVAAAFNVQIQFLNKRETKELPLAELTLSRCNDTLFHKVIVELEMQELKSRGSLWTKLAVYLFPASYIAHIMQTPRSPRYILQRWGSEYKRKMCADNYWLKKVEDFLQLNRGSDIVVTDVRFPNEVAFVKERGGALWRVTRPNIEMELARERGQGGAANHPSETELLLQECEVNLLNQEGKIEDLRRQVIQHARAFLDARGKSEG